MASLTDFPAPSKKKDSLTDFPAPKRTDSLLDFPAPSAKLAQAQALVPEVGTPDYASPFADYVPVFTGEQAARGLFPGQTLPRDVADAQIATTINPELNRSAIASDLETIQKLQQPVKPAVGVVQNVANRVGTGISLLDAFLNTQAMTEAKMQRRVAERAKGKSKLGQYLETYTPAESWEILKSGFTQTPFKETAQKGLSGEEFVPYNVIQTLKEQGPEGNVYQQLYKDYHIHPAVLDFLISFPVSELAGSAQNQAVSLLQKGIAKTGVLEKAAQGIPPLQRAIEHNKQFRGAQAAMVGPEARSQRVLKTAADVAEDSYKTSQKYLKQGVPLRDTNPVTNQPVNKFEELVADFMDAGNPGSKYEAIHPPAPEHMQKVENVYGVLKNSKTALPKAEAKIAAGEVGLPKPPPVPKTSQQLAREAKAATGAHQAALVDAEKSAQQFEAASAARKTAEQAATDAETAAADAVTKREAIRKQPNQPGIVSASKRAGILTERARTARQAAKQAARLEEKLFKVATAKADAARKAGVGAGEAATAAATAAEQERLAETASRQKGNQGLQAALENARGAMPKIEANQADLMQARVERRGAEIAQIAHEASKLGVDMKDVQRIGEGYSNVLDQLGQQLVDYGLLDPGKYAELKGQYLPRLYLLTKGDPTDVNAFLGFLESEGAITPQAMFEAKSRLSQRGLFQRGTGVQTFNKSRELTSFEERNAQDQARALVPEATPAALHGIEAQARAAAQAEGHDIIANNPLLAKPRNELTMEESMSWKPFQGKGPLEGMALAPGVDDYLRTKNMDLSAARLLEATGKPGAIKAAKIYRRVSKTMKALWVSSPTTAVNNAVGNYELGSAGAAINSVDGHHVNYTVPGYVQALDELRGARKGGAVPQVLQEAADSGILSEGSQLLPRGAKQVGGGYGVETTAEKLKGVPGKLYDLYAQNAYEDVEKAGRYYLFKELRNAGYSPEVAAQKVNAIMISYSDIGIARRLAEQNPIFGLPFITFPTKAVFQYLNTALRRPDKFSTYTGQRWAQFLDQLAGPDAMKRRAAGEEAGGVGPADFPVNGKYYRIPQLAPILQMGGLQPGEGPLDFTTERLWSMAPGINLIRNLATNQKDIGVGKTVPIVPPGSIPGVMGSPVTSLWPPRVNKEAAGAYGLQLGRSIAPEVGALYRVYKAWKQEPEYNSPGSPVPSMADAILRGLTGISAKQGIGENRLEKSFDVNEMLREEADPAVQKAGTERANEVANAWLRDPQNYTPNADYQRTADAVPEEKLPEALKNASASLALFVTRKKGTPEERVQRVKDLVDWIMVLALAQARKVKAQAQFLTPEQRAPIEGALSQF